MSAKWEIVDHERRAWIYQVGGGKGYEDHPGSTDDVRAGDGYDRGIRDGHNQSDDSISALKGNESPSYL